MKEDWFNGTALLLLFCLIGAYTLLSPNFLGHGGRSPVNACINTLRQLDGAMEQWRLENNRGTNEFPTLAEALVYMKGPLTCPSNGRYRYDTNAGRPVCSVPGHVLP